MMIKAIPHNSAKIICKVPQTQLCGVAVSSKIIKKPLRSGAAQPIKREAMSNALLLKKNLCVYYENKVKRPFGHPQPSEPVHHKTRQRACEL